MTQDPDFDRRHAAALTEMAVAGMKASQANPLGARLLAKAGFRTIPAPYRSFQSNTLFMGLYFGVLWGVLMYFWIWRGQNMTVQHAVAAAAVAGLLFGLGMAAVANWQRKRWHLSRWQDL